MNDNIDKNEIRKAIDRLQAEHPCGIAYDPTAFVNMEAVNTIKGCIDKIARRMMEDTEINIICEFAKLYLEGVRPTVKPKQEWIPCSERLPDKFGIYLVTNANGVVFEHNYNDATVHGGAWWSYCENKIVAWMPLPEPYKDGAPDA